MIVDKATTNYPVHICIPPSGWSLFYKVKGAHAKNIPAKIEGSKSDYVEYVIGAWHLLLVTTDDY